VDTLIVAGIVLLAVVYLVKRYVRMFKAQSENTCDCGCSGCSQETTCRDQVKTIQARPCGDKLSP
jgi:hypothetical protein